MFVPAYLNSAKEILTLYKGEEPFHSFLKKYFSLNKRFGSRDRKQIAHLCYCFFRLGKSLMNTPIEKRLLLGIFLCDKEKNTLLQSIDPQLNEEVGKSLDEKLKFAESFGLYYQNIFLSQDELSEDLNFKEFVVSFLSQPKVYLRIRPGYQDIVFAKFDQHNIPFHRVNNDCISVEPSIKLDEVLEINKEVVIQDINSQKVLQPLIHTADKKQIRTAWDCCAASGGKSILLKDFFPSVELTVSDIRESILINLEKRFKLAGIKNYRKLIVDLSNFSFPKNERFDLIICDAPCSGSGTWSRTPEQLYFFKKEKIEYYAGLQKKIVGNAVKSLRSGGYFVYITCSVFKRENEQVVEYIQNNFNLQLINKTYLKGYCDKADTLFAALFTSIS